MALTSVIVNDTAGLTHTLTIDAGSTPVNLTIQWKRAGDTAFTTIRSLTAKSGSFTETINWSSTQDITAPSTPIIDIPSMTYDHVTNVFTANISAPDTDEGTPIIYNVIDTTSQVTKTDLTANIVAGVQTVIVAMDHEEGTLVTKSDQRLSSSTYTKSIADTGEVAYLHAATLDIAGNLSDTYTMAIDLTPPSQDTTFYINDIQLGVNNQSLSFGTNRLLVTSTGGSQLRGVPFFRDIKLVNADSQEVLATLTRLSTVTGVDLGVAPFGNPRITATTNLKLVVTTYNVLGSTLGPVSSKTFKINLASPSVKLTFIEDLPLLIESSTFSSMSLKWTTSGAMAGNIIKYRIEYRNRPNYSSTWSAWTSIGESYTTSHSIPAAKIKLNGFNVHELRVCGVTANGDTSFFSYPTYIADILPVVSSSNTDILYVVRIPTSVFNLVDRKLVLSTTMNGITTKHSITMAYDTLTGSIGGNDISFITLPINPDKHINNDGSANKENIMSDIRSSQEELQTDSRFTASPVTYSTKIDTKSTDVYMVGYLYRTVSSIPASYNLTYTKDPTNSFKQTATVNITSSTSIVRNSDQIAELTIPTPISNRVVAKYGTLLAPILGYAASYDDQNPDPEISEFFPPIKLIASLATDNSALPSANTAIKLSYTRSLGSTNEEVDDYSPSTNLTKPGSYTVYGQVEYTDGSTVLTSPETILGFTIIDAVGSYVAPATSINNTNNIGSVDGSIGVTVTTNVKPEKVENSTYVYKLVNSTKAGTLILNSNATLTTNVAGDQVMTVTLGTSFLAYGANTVDLVVTYNGTNTSYPLDIDFIKPISNPSTSTGLLGVPTYHRAESYSTAANYNDATSTIPATYNPKLNMVVYTYNGKNRATLDGYKLPMYYGTSVTAKKFDTPSGLRTSIMDVSTTFTGTATATQTIDLSLRDDTTAPPTPALTVTAGTPLTPFSATAATDCHALNNIAFTASNTSTDYTVNMFIDGKAYTPGSTYTKAGRHVLNVIYANTYNYKISSKVVNFEITTVDDYFPPVIAVSPDNKWSTSYTYTVTWATGTADSALITKKEILADGGSWTTVTGTTSTYVANVTDHPRATYVFTARKWYADGTSRTTTYTMNTADMIRQVTPPTPAMDFDVSTSEKSTAVYTPALRPATEWTYSYKLNGQSYTPGTPITLYRHDTLDLTLDIKVTDRYSSATATTSKTVNLDTVAPVKPKLKSFTYKAVYLPTDFSSIDVENRESGVTYTILLDGKVIRAGTSLSSNLAVKDLRKSHTIMIYAQKTSNRMVNFSSYTFIVNTSSVTSSFHTKKLATKANGAPSGTETRLPIIPLTRRLETYDTPGELVVDKINGDLAVVTKTALPSGAGYKLAEITKDLRFSIREVDSFLDHSKKVFAIYKDQLRSYTFPVSHLTTTTANLTTATNSLVSAIDAIDNKLTKDKATNTSTSTSAASLNTRLTAAEPNVNAIAYSNITALLSTYATTKAKILSDHEKHLDLTSLISKIYFNLYSIELILNPKVSKTAFNAFKAKHLAFYKDAKSKIDNFS